LAHRFHDVHVAADLRIGDLADASMEKPPADRGSGKTEPPSLQNTETLPNEAASESTQPRIKQAATVARALSMNRRSTEDFAHVFDVDVRRRPKGLGSFRACLHQCADA
jgi:hypothetical protein